MVEESGGVLPNTAIENDGLFEFLEADSQLGLTARSVQTQNNHHIYHQFEVDDAFTIFHVFDAKRQKDLFTEFDVQNNQDFYPKSQNDLLIDNTGNGIIDTIRVFNFNNDVTFESTIYRLYQNKAGIKGKLANFNYIAYFRNQIFSYNTRYQGQALIFLNPDSTTDDSRSLLEGDYRLAEVESFIGGELFYTFNEDARLTARAEIALGTDYLLEGTFYNKNLELTFKSTLYSPSLIQRRFVSNHFYWDRSYNNTLANELSGSISFTFGDLYLKPFGSYRIINNYIYFDQNAASQQESNAVQLAQAGLDLNYKIGRFFTQNKFIYTESLGADLFRVPRFFANSRIYCEDCVIKKLIHSQIGVDIHYKSAYFADAYMPVSKQFYLQDAFNVEGYLLIDLFVNIRLKNVRGFLKLAHINEPSSNGYITTPFYPGQRRSFIIGLNWRFFN